MPPQLGANESRTIIHPRAVEAVRDNEKCNHIFNVEIHRRRNIRPNRDGVFTPVEQSGRKGASTGVNPRLTYPSALALRIRVRGVKDNRAIGAMEVKPDP